MTEPSLHWLPMTRSLTSVQTALTACPLMCGSSRMRRAKERECCMQ